LLYQYAALKKKIDLAQKRLIRLSLVDKYLSSIILNSPTRLAQGRITKDKIKLVERDLIFYRNLLYQTWNKANIYLNLESEPNIKVVWLNDQNYLGKNFLITAALDNNLNLQEQKFLISKSKSELSLAKIEKMPDVNLSVSRQNNSSGSNSSNSDAVGLSLSVPLINRNQEKILAAKYQIKAQESQFEFQKNQLTNNLNNDISQFEMALKIAKNFPLSDIDKTINRLNVANGEFKKGVLDFITYIELDSQEYQIIDVIINTQVDLASSYANLMTKIGTFILPKNE
jgi:outer membrane protein TolC